MAIAVTAARYLDKSKGRLLRSDKKIYQRWLTSHIIVTNYLPNGISHGHSYTYNETTKVLRKSEYRQNGLNHGVYESWDDSGFQIIRAFYLNGNREGVEQVYSANRLLRQSEYVNNQKHGICEEYNDAGALVSRANYAYGQPNGIMELYNHKTDVALRITNWKDGKHYDFWEQRYTNGRRIRVSNIHGDVQIAEEWRSDGSLECRTEMKDCKPHGLREEFDMQGNCVSQTYHYVEN